MIRFLLGLIIGIGIGGAGMYLWNHRGKIVDEALRPSAADAGPSAPEKPGKRRGAGGAHTASVAPGDPDIVLSDADLRVGSEGDALSAHNTIDMGGAEARDLSQEEIDGAFGRRSSAIVKCITDARGAAPLNGRVTCGVVVAADGSVGKTRVEAPAWLLHHGLSACVRPLLRDLRFPPAGKETVVTVPFDLHD